MVVLCISGIFFHFFWISHTWSPLEASRAIHPNALMHDSRVFRHHCPISPAIAKCSDPNIRPSKNSELQFHTGVRTPFICHREHARRCGARPGDHCWAGRAGRGRRALTATCGLGLTTRGFRSSLICRLGFTTRGFRSSLTDRLKMTTRGLNSSLTCRLGSTSQGFR